MHKDKIRIEEHEESYYSSLEEPIGAKESKLLEQYGIKTRRDFKQWMLRNHPDKNPNIELNLVQEISAAVDLILS